MIPQIKTNQNAENFQNQPDVLISGIYGLDENLVLQHSTNHLGQNVPQIPSASDASIGRIFYAAVGGKVVLGCVESAAQSRKLPLDKDNGFSLLLSVLQQICQEAQSPLYIAVDSQSLQQWFLPDKDDEEAPSHPFIEDTPQEKRLKRKRRMFSKELNYEIVEGIETDVLDEILKKEDFEYDIVTSSDGTKGFYLTLNKKFNEDIKNIILFYLKVRELMKILMQSAPSKKSPQKSPSKKKKHEETKQLQPSDSTTLGNPTPTDMDKTVDADREEGGNIDPEEFQDPDDQHREPPTEQEEQDMLKDFFGTPLEKVPPKCQQAFNNASQSYQQHLKSLDSQTASLLKTELFGLAEKVFDKKNAQKASIYSGGKTENHTVNFQKVINKNIKNLKQKSELKALFDQYMKDHISGKGNPLEKDIKSRFTTFLKDFKGFNELDKGEQEKVLLQKGQVIKVIKGLYTDLVEHLNDISALDVKKMKFDVLKDEDGNATGMRIVEDGSKTIRLPPKENQQKFKRIGLIAAMGRENKDGASIGHLLFYQGELISKQLLKKGIYEEQKAFDGTIKNFVSLAHGDKFQELLSTEASNIHMAIDNSSNSWIIARNEDKVIFYGTFSSRGNFEEKGNIKYPKKGGINSVKGLCTVPYQSLFLILDDKGGLWKCNYKEITQLYSIIVDKHKEIVNEPLTPSKPGESYVSIQSSPDGQYFLIRSQSTIDVYDINFHFVQGIPVKEAFTSSKVIAEGSDLYLVQQLGMQFEVIKFKGLTEIKRDDEDDDPRKKVPGNPIIDYNYLAEKCYSQIPKEAGPKAVPQLILQDNNQETKQKVDQYFKSLYGVESQFSNGIQAPGKLKSSKLADILGKSTVFSIFNVGDQSGSKLTLLDNDGNSINEAQFAPVLQLPVEEQVEDDKEEEGAEKEEEKKLESSASQAPATAKSNKNEEEKNSSTEKEKVRKKTGIVRDRHYQSELLEEIINEEDVMSTLFSVLGFGDVEQQLKQIEGPVSVIGISGKASSEHLGIMNGILGTRFNAQSSDQNIQAQIVGTENNNILIISNQASEEGHGRSEVQNMKITALQLAFSDHFIFNHSEEISKVHRQLNGLVGKAYHQFTGPSLFKGAAYHVSYEGMEEKNSLTQKITQIIQKIKKIEQDNGAPVFPNGHTTSILPDHEGLDSPLFLKKVNELRGALFKKSRQPRFKDGLTLLLKLKAAVSMLYFGHHQTCDDFIKRASFKDLIQNSINNFEDVNTFMAEEVELNQDIQIGGKTVIVDHKLFNIKFLGIEGEENIPDMAQFQQLFDEQVGTDREDPLYVDQFNSLINHFFNFRSKMIDEFIKETQKETGAPLNQHQQATLERVRLELKKQKEYYLLKSENKEEEQKQKKCPMRCIVCAEPCSSNDRSHDERCQTLNLPGHPKHGQKVHLCSNPHPCEMICSKAEKQCCEASYAFEERTWDSTLFEYTFTEAKPIKINHRCSTIVPPGSLQHQGAHDCGVKHRCGSACPECRSVCIQYEGHKGLHSGTHTHRKDQTFVDRTKNAILQIQQETGVTRIYFENEPRTPENCDQMCKRRGRNHFHLKKCAGGNQCAQKKGVKGVIHSNEQYYPESEFKYDLFLCEAYWMSYNWMPPYGANAELSNTINQCNFYCGHKSHAGSIIKNYCTKKAWHTYDHHSGQHSFGCTHPKRAYADIDIVFVLDTTNSMEPYFVETIKSVKKLMSEAQKKVNDSGCQGSMQFGVVCYRDHEPEEINKAKKEFSIDTYLTKVRNLSDANSIIEFVEKIDTNKGFDFPEAVLDGINGAVDSITWRESADRMIFHIGDAPPHGVGIFNDLEGYDNFPKGCPCDLNHKTIMEEMNRRNITYFLIKLTPYQDMMVNQFREFKSDIIELNLAKAEELPVKVTEAVLEVIDGMELGGDK